MVPQKCPKLDLHGSALLSVLFTCKDTDNNLGRFSLYSCHMRNLIIT